MTAFVPLVAALLAGPAAPTPLELPDGAAGIGFDDLVFSSELHRLLVPAGRTGRIDLVDPATRAVESIPGFSSAPSRRGDHAQGTTSADAGGGIVFAIDRDRRILAAVDPAAGRILARSSLGGAPDYVRWVAPVGEVWVTEPDRSSIETFRFEGGGRPALSRTGTIRVPGGPESLVVDAAAGRAYTNTFRDATLEVDVRSRAVVARWPNRCRGARGIALDPDRRLVFVGCGEGKAVALDAAHGGATVGEARTGDGVDGIAYGPLLSHLYVPAGSSGDLTVLGVGARGQLEPLGTVAAAPDAHCAAADDRGNVWVCDPGKGRLLVLHDPFPASR